MQTPEFAVESINRQLRWKQTVRQVEQPPVVRNDVMSYIISWVLSIIAVVLSILNIIRFFYIIYDPGILSGWQSLDFQLLYTTAIIFIIWILYTEIDARYVLSEAKKSWASSRKWIDKES